MLLRTIIFPGQGSQKVGMGKELFDFYPDCIAFANDILGYDIKKLCLDNTEDLNNTLYTQPCLYVTNYLYYLSYIENFPAPDIVLGHSLGEFNALLCADVFDFQTGLRLVKKRAELMSQSSDGAMLVVLGLTLPEVQEEMFKNFPGLDIANINTEKQIVISGDKGNIHRASLHFEEMNVAVIPLNVSGAFHSRYMRKIQHEFEIYVLSLSFSSPKIPVIANCTARPYNDPEISQLIIQQMGQPVRWLESINYLFEQYDDIEFIEVGPGKVLSNLVAKIKKERKCEVENA